MVSSKHGYIIHANRPFPIAQRSQRGLRPSLGFGDRVSEAGYLRSHTDEMADEDPLARGLASTRPTIRGEDGAFGLPWSCVLRSPDRLVAKWKPPSIPYVC